MAPILASFAMFSRWMACIGVSLGTSIRSRLSFRWTSAALMTKFSEYPWAIAEMVFIVAGIMTIVSTLKLPLAIGASMFEGL